MTITAHVYQIYIAATPEEVWSAITESEWTRRYLHGTFFVEGPAPGLRYLTRAADGRDAVEGVVEVMQPPAEDRPGRLVQTWRTLYDPALAEEPPSRVEWTVQAAGEGLTRVRLVHGDLAASPRTWRAVKDGWVWILDGLKTVLETGRPLPAPTAEDAGPAGGDPLDAEPAEDDWHRAQGVRATNAASSC